MGVLFLLRRRKNALKPAPIYEEHEERRGPDIVPLEEDPYLNLTGGRATPMTMAFNAQDPFAEHSRASNPPAPLAENPYDRPGQTFYH
jgi:hypothetical protein